MILRYGADEAPVNVLGFVAGGFRLGRGLLLGRSLFGGSRTLDHGALDLGAVPRPSRPSRSNPARRCRHARSQVAGPHVDLGLGGQFDLAVPFGGLAGAFDAGDAKDRFHLAVAVGAAIALAAGLLEDLDLLALAGLDQGRRRRRRRRSAGAPRVTPLSPPSIRTLSNFSSAPASPSSFSTTMVSPG